MTDFLYKIKLIQDLNFKLNVSKIEFTKKFIENVDESSLDFELFEEFQTSKNEYKGIIFDNYFELKKRRRFFDTRYSFVEATGQLVEDNEQLNIEIEISGFKKRMIFFFAAIVIFYLIFILGAFFAEDNKAPFFILPFVLIHMTFMLGLPYFVIKRSVSKMAYDLERDFHYWITKN